MLGAWEAPEGQGPAQPFFKANDVRQPLACSRSWPACPSRVMERCFHQGTQPTQRHTSPQQTPRIYCNLSDLENTPRIVVSPVPKAGYVTGNNTTLGTRSAPPKSAFAQLPVIGVMRLRDSPRFRSPSVTSHFPVTLLSSWPDVGE